MSLFEDSAYQWRETYFLFFPAANHPAPEDVEEMLAPLKNRMQVRESLADANGRLEAMTIIAPGDAAGMDVTFVEEEEVIEQREDLEQEMKKGTWSEQEKLKWNMILQAKCRFDVFHFEQRTTSEPDADPDMDPGAILSVLSKLAKLCHGVAYDPQSAMFL